MAVIRNRDGKSRIRCLKHYTTVPGHSPWFAAMTVVDDVWIWVDANPLEVCQLML